MKMVKKIAKKITNELKNVGGSVAFATVLVPTYGVQLVTNLVQEGAAFVDSKLTKFTETVENARDKFLGNVETVEETVTEEKKASLWSKISSGATKIINSAKERCEEVTEAVSKSVKGCVETVSRKATRVYQTGKAAVLSACESVVSFGAKALDNCSDGLKSSAGSLAELGNKIQKSKINCQAKLNEQDNSNTLETTVEKHEEFDQPQVDTTKVSTKESTAGADHPKDETLDSNTTETTDEKPSADTEEVSTNGAA